MYIAMLIKSDKIQRVKGYKYKSYKQKAHALQNSAKIQQIFRNKTIIHQRKGPLAEQRLKVSHLECSVRQ